jgi:hypothetical protein
MNCFQKEKAVGEINSNQMILTRIRGRFVSMVFTLKNLIFQIHKICRSFAIWHLIIFFRFIYTAQIVQQKIT